MALQVNVRELVCCDKPDQFGSVRAIPDFKVCFTLALIVPLVHVWALSKTLSDE